MKSSALKILLLLIAVAILCGLLCGCDEAPDISDQCVRIHIRANSNSDADQVVKLKVRDAICDYLNTKLPSCKSKSDALATLSRERANIVDIANKTLYLYNFDYKASIRISSEHFPERTYGEYTFPEGVYDAVIVELGKGVGNNWWCVAFPPLCFLPSNGGEEVIYRSWVKEQLDKIFDKAA